jgi:hypothetical protein
MNPSSHRLARLRRILLSAALALATAGPALAQVGGNHPSSGQYSPVNQSSWGSATWPLGATFTA